MLRFLGLFLRSDHIGPEEIHCDWHFLDQRLYSTVLSLHVSVKNWLCSSDLYIEMLPHYFEVTNVLTKNNTLTTFVLFLPCFPFEVSFGSDKNSLKYVKCNNIKGTHDGK